MTSIIGNWIAARTDCGQPAVNFFSDPKYKAYLGCTDEEVAEGWCR